jgi:diguanylate cyclase (GGDEF)-like protein
MANPDASRGDDPRTEPIPPSVKWLILGTAVVAIALSLVIGFGSIGPHVNHAIPWPFISLALLGVQLTPVEFHTERQSVSFDLCGPMVLLGATFTSPKGLLAAALIASALDNFILRNPPLKTAFNVPNQVVGVALALLVLNASLGSASPASLHGWWALSLALFTYDSATTLGVLAAVWLAAGRPGRQYLETLGLHLALVLPFNAALGIVAVTVTWTQRWGILLLAGPGLALGLWYRAASSVRARYADLQLLYGFTIKLAGLSEREEVLAVALQEARSLLRCHHAELSVAGSETSTRFVVDGAGQLSREHVEQSSFERDLVSGGQPVLIPRGRRDEVIGERGFVDLMAVPIQVAEQEVGVLLLADREGGSATFDADALRLFETLAAHLSTALTSSRRLDRLRHEVAAREHEALHDSLTGLANRTLFTQWVSTALRRRTSSQRVAVMLMDLDGFKEINDTLGHHTGDAILKEIGQRVLAAVGPQRLAARLGGDEFAFVLPAAASLEEVTTAAHALLQSVSTAIEIDGLVLSMRASIGVSMAPVHGTDPSTLLKRADVAMYAAKTGTSGLTVYDPGIDHYSTRRLLLASELRQAVDDNELEVWYQPLARLRSGEICGFEALLRWRHSQYGAVSPNEFIPIAEQTGLIEPLTWWVLRQALQQLRTWQNDGYQMTMAVNVSARNLLDTGIVERLRALMAEIGIAPASLTLEITESSIMLEPDRSERILRHLAELGVSIAIDDFGTGYSSLSRLKTMPVHTVKIDRTFVKHLCADDGDEAIVRTTIELARNMGHRVVAEGVEDRATWDRLLELGCDLAQGFYLSAALPAEQCGDWLRSRQSPSLAPVRMLRPLAQGA